MDGYVNSQRDRGRQPGRAATPRMGRVAAGAEPFVNSPAPSGKAKADQQDATPPEIPVEYPDVEGELARLVREARRNVNLSQERIARKIEVSPGYIAHIETGRTKKPSRRVLHRLAKALRVEVGPLLNAAGYTDEDQERFMRALADDRNLHRREKEIIRQLYLSWVAPSED